MKDTIIFDLDGTIALDHKRAPLLEIQHEKHCRRDNEDCSCKKRNWDAWYEACDTDDPNIPVIAVLNQLAKVYSIQIVSGRSQKVFLKTVGWLRKHKVLYDKIHLRPDGDHTEDTKLKIQWAEKFGKENILCVFEDRNRVVKAWRDAGITCFQVALTAF